MTLGALGWGLSGVRVLVQPDGFSGPVISTCMHTSVHTLLHTDRPVCTEAHTCIYRYGHFYTHTMSGAVLA